MKNKIVNEHIQNMYSNWLKKSKGYCYKYGLKGQASDLLQEILSDILSKNPEKLSELTENEANNYEDLDHYILKMLWTNARSDSAPYRQRYVKPALHIDYNVDPFDLEIIDESYTDESYQNILEIYHHLDITAQEKKIFEFYYLEHKQIKHWPGPEHQNKVYKICRSVIDKIKNEVKKNCRK